MKLFDSARSLLLSLALLTGVLPPAFAQTAERTLSNGLKVLVLEDHRAPTVVHMVWYRAGSLDEFNGTTGVAHVLEHMMFKGTESVGPGEFSRRVAALGGRENAFTSRDYTGYYQQIGREHLAEVMGLEADRMAHLKLDAEAFSREIQVVMEERRLRTEDRAQALLFEQFMATMFTASPYRAPVVGWMNDLEAMTVEDARDWYQRWYSPSNAIVVVAGDVRAEDVFRLAQETYGRIASRALPARKPQQEPPQRGVRRLQVKAPADNPSVLLGFRVPALRQVEADDEVYALEVLSSVLDLGDTGRLTREIVRGSRVANQAGAGYDMTQRGPAFFLLSGTPADGRTTQEVEEALRAQIRRIADEGVSEAELARVKTQYVATHTYRRDSVMGQAMEAAGLEIAGYSHRDADRILERIGAVTAAQVQDAAKRHFSEDVLTVATLVPQPVATPRAPAPAASGLRH